ncbi:hypothetical protein HJC23_007551 [Cyclotella cryptica]|uniref:SET domain-containing protein n=1 Tax=Cyclotella cryptica TaxID=29204 RepID=A0ABD3QRE9_9STRA|eukprot:CCRYP_002808-RA/>CCRYP_002808-RA protein AED:0.38 eAED:0.38 QI:400/1/1/1/0/0/3/192/163
MERMAFYFASSRDEHTLMILIHDMANHSNDPDKLNNLSFRPDKTGKSFWFQEAQTILAGEQIYNSYNRCNPCSEADFDNCETLSSQPIPDMFAHFGLVESLPQYWRLDSSEEVEEGDEIEMCLSQNSSGTWRYYGLNRVCRMRSIFVASFEAVEGNAYQKSGL